MILPPGHAQNVASRRRLTKRERWILSGVLATVAALAIATVIALTTADPKSGNGCIYVTAPSFIGAQQASGCGEQARAICRSAATGPKNGYAAEFQREILAECRKQGIPAS